MGDRLFLALERAVAALQSADVEYAFIGGFAALIRGRLRFTQDLDILILCSRDDYGRLVEAFRHQGFAPMDRADRHRLDDVDLLRFWLPVKATEVSVGVDIQVARHESLKYAVRQASQEEYHGLKLRVATREALILLKLSAWRPIDRADAIELASLAPPDWEFLESCAKELQILEPLREVQGAVAQN